MQLISLILFHVFHPDNKPVSALAGSETSESQSFQITTISNVEAFSCICITLLCSLMKSPKKCDVFLALSLARTLSPSHLSYLLINFPPLPNHCKITNTLRSKCLNSVSGILQDWIIPTARVKEMLRDICARWMIRGPLCCCHCS